MNNQVFYFRLSYIIILVTLTLCYIFGDVIHSWWDWFSGLVYGLIISDLLKMIKKLRRKKNRGMNKFSLDEVINIVAFVLLTFCYVAGDVVQYHLNWTSGFAYALALKGLRETFKEL